jgi:hypothetical protein
LPSFGRSKTQVKAKPHGTTMYSLLGGTTGRRKKKGQKKRCVFLEARLGSHDFVMDVQYGERGSYLLCMSVALIHPNMKVLK